MATAKSHTKEATPSDYYEQELSELLDCYGNIHKINTSTIHTDEVRINAETSVSTHVLSKIREAGYEIREIQGSSRDYRFSFVVGK